MAAGNTYTQIASTTLGTAASTVTFSSISGAYTDLVLVYGGTNSINGSLRFQVNGDTASNYSYNFVYGDGTSAVSGRATSQTSGLTGSITAGTIASHIAQFQNYSNATTYKTILARANDTQSVVIATVNLWRSTAAINSIVCLLTGGGNFTAGSTFNLYGIAAA
jgi:hypothetical protein